MLKIGLTGGIGSGKSTVAKFFAELGITVIDADDIIHELLETSSYVKQKIIDHFGAKVLTKDDRLDRKALRISIFNDKKERAWLENLLHPLACEIMEKKVKLVKSPYCVLVIPLLFEANLFYLVDRVLVVESSEDRQINRAAIRDQANSAEIKKIMNAQVAREERISKADDVICNDGSLEELKNKVIVLHKKYRDLAHAT